MGEVDHHAQAVELTDDGLAELRQAVMARLVGGGIDPLIFTLFARHKRHLCAALQEPDRIEDHRFPGPK